VLNGLLLILLVDLKNEYVIVDVNSGSMGTSGILKVLVKLDLGLKEIDFAKIVSNGLWNRDVFKKETEGYISKP